MYYGYMELSKLVGAEIHYREFNGKMERCLSIPIELNGLGENNSTSEYSRRVFLQFLANDMKPNPNNYTHYLSLYCRDKEVVENIRKYDYFKELRFLGKMRPGLWNSHYYSNVKSIDDALNTD